MSLNFHFLFIIFVYTFSFVHLYFHSTRILTILLLVHIFFYQKSHRLMKLINQQ